MAAWSNLDLPFPRITPNLLHEPPLLYSFDVTEEPTGGLRSRKTTALLCAAIFVIAFGIRLLGIGWGLKNDLHNQSYHPDEPLIFDYVHKSFLYRGQPEREYYNYGTLYYAILKAADVVRPAFGGVPPPDTLSTDTFRDPEKWDRVSTYVSQFHLAGRVVSALAGAGTAVLVFLILARWVSILGALAGAALITFSPAHLEHSRFQTVDIVSLFFISLATLACLRLLRPELTDSKQWQLEVALAGALIGLSGGTRFTNVILIFSLLAVLAIRRPKSWPALAFLGAVMTGMFFAIATPGSVTDSAYFMSNLEFQSNHANTGHALVFVGTPNGFVMTIQNLMAGISAGAALLGLAGLVYAAVRKHAWAWVVLAFFVPYYYSIGRLEVKFVRYGFPLYLGVAAGFGYAVSAIQRRFNSRWLAAGVGALSMIGLEHPQSGVRGVVAFTSWMMGPDPRDQAQRYLIEQATKGLQTQQNIAVGFIDDPWFWDVPASPDATYLKFHPEDRDWYYQEFFPRYRIARFKSSRGREVLPIPVRLGVGDYPAYATYTSYEAEDFRRLNGRTDLPSESQEQVNQMKTMYDRMYELYQEEKVFGQGGPTLHDLEYIQPTVYVMRRRS